MATFNVELEVDTPSKTKHIHNPSSVRYEKKIYIVLNYQIKIIQLYHFKSVLSIPILILYLRRH